MSAVHLAYSDYDSANGHVHHHDLWPIITTIGRVCRLGGMKSPCTSMTIATALAGTSSTMATMSFHSANASPTDIPWVMKKKKKVQKLKYDELDETEDERELHSEFGHHLEWMKVKCRWRCSCGVEIFFLGLALPRMWAGIFRRQSCSRVRGGG